MLKGDNIYLRTIEPADADTILTWENDVENWRVSNTKVPFSKHLIHQYVNSAQDLLEVRQIRFMICDNLSQQAIGSLDLFEYEPIHQRIGVGILIDKANRNRGIGLEALNIMANYALTILGIRNLYCSVLANNPASMRLFEKAGYAPVGVRKNWFNDQGNWIDEVLYQKALL